MIDDHEDQASDELIVMGLRSGFITISDQLLIAGFSPGHVVAGLINAVAQFHRAAREVSRTPSGVPKAMRDIADMLDAEDARGAGKLH